MKPIKIVILKILILVALTTGILSENGHAQSSTLPPPKMLLLKAERFPGFTPDPKYISITLFTTGEVEKTTKSRTGVIIETLAQLGNPVLNRIRIKLNSFPIVPLIDTEEGRPMCMDAGSSSYKLYKSITPNETPIEFSAERGCHSFKMFADDTETFRLILDGFLEL